MILLRARRHGTGEWTNIMIQTPGVDDESEDDMERDLAAIVGSALGTSPLHIQQLTDEGIWEEVE